MTILKILIGMVIGGGIILGIFVSGNLDRKEVSKIEDCLCLLCKEDLTYEDIEKLNQKPCIKKDCPKCEPYAKIENAKVYCDTTPYLKTIKSLQEQVKLNYVNRDCKDYIDLIKGMNEQVECLKDKCISFGDVKC